MYRQQHEFLVRWLNSKNRKPLIIRGARQVGKSTLVEMFAQEQSLPLMNVNLERFSGLGEVFASNDPKQIINSIEMLPRMPERRDTSLLFLDEIQAAVQAIPALRYFHEELPQLPLIGAGSLLEFALSDHKFSMPVGRVQYLHMGPMTFSEFLLALGEKKLYQIVTGYSLHDAIPALAHQRLLQLLRQYYFVGGMPEAVAAFVETGSLQAVSEVHNSIIDTCREDFPKYGSRRNLNRMLTVFNFVARNAGAKVKYSNISRDEQTATLKKDLELLCMARVASKVVHSHCSGLPLQASLNEKTYKLLFLDVGLMNAVCGLNGQSILQMDEQRLVNEGAIAEQFIGQHLQALLADTPNRELTYWLREGRSSNAEVDYVLALSGRVVPIEVKSGATGSMKSLHQFVGEKQLAGGQQVMGQKPTSLAVRFDASLPSVTDVQATISRNKQTESVRYSLYSLPLYLVERLKQIIEAASEE
ncbi:MAG: AAA family ATPase [Gammaproteobacteria bacterium]|nr:MAG: AAA family ATPase [Pseudomonadota bacterium]PIE38183.1 MAG: AAA family ATPase [Gammaproteobacteria bacterium]